MEQKPSQIPNDLFFCCSVVSYILLLSISLKLSGSFWWSVLEMQIRCGSCGLFRRNIWYSSDMHLFAKKNIPKCRCSYCCGEKLQEDGIFSHPTIFPCMNLHSSASYFSVNSGTIIQTPNFSFQMIKVGMLQSADYEPVLLISHTR